MASSRRPTALNRGEQFVVACVRIANQHRIEPFLVAQQARGWERSQWEQAYAELSQGPFERLVTLGVE